MIRQNFIVIYSTIRGRRHFFNPLLYQSGIPTSKKTHGTEFDFIQENNIVTYEKVGNAVRRKYAEFCDVETGGKCSYKWSLQFSCIILLYN